MSKAGIIMAVAVVVALVGAGAGVYFTPNENDTVEIGIKDLFEVGDEHTRVMERDIVLEISNIRTVGGVLIFDVYGNGGLEASDQTYEDLTYGIIDGIVFDESESDAVAGDEVRISTPFGDRDCIMYTYDHGDGSKSVYYVGKDNNVVYRNEYLVNDVVFTTYTLQKSDLLIESNTAIGLKNAGDIEEGDSYSFKLMYTYILVIEGVNLPEGDGAVTYDVRVYRSLLEVSLTRDEIIRGLVLILPEEVRDSAVDVRIENMDTSLGRVKCLAYTCVEGSGTEITYYVSNDVLVMIGGIASGNAKIYWENTDLVVAK
jgi:hypothetical protein